MLNVSRVLYNKRFNQPFTVHRKIGAWNRGRFVETEQILTFTGVVLPASSTEIMQFPEGDRSTAMMVFHSDQEIFVTRVNDGQGYAGTSDVVECREYQYRVISVSQYNDYGYFTAYGVQMEGE